MWIFQEQREGEEMANVEERLALLEEKQAQILAFLTGKNPLHD
jgi:hypothetical protein